MCNATCTVDKDSEDDQTLCLCTTRPCGHKSFDPRHNVCFKLANIGESGRQKDEKVQFGLMRHQNDIRVTHI